MEPQKGSYDVQGVVVVMRTTKGVCFANPMALERLAMTRSFGRLRKAAFGKTSGTKNLAVKVAKVEHINYALNLPSFPPVSA